MDFIIICGLIGLFISFLCYQIIYCRLNKKIQNNIFSSRSRWYLANLKSCFPFILTFGFCLGGIIGIIISLIYKDF